MDRGDVAFVAIDRGEAAHVAGRDGAGRKSLFGEMADHRIEGDAMAAHDHDIRRARGTADQLDLRLRADIEPGAERIDGDEARPSGERGHRA
jgi:hypothetical protein